MKLNLAYFYPEELNLYGDTGNVEILKYRAEKRGIEASVTEIASQTELSAEKMSQFNLVFMGGGPDSGQHQMYKDLVSNKKPYLQEYIEKGGVALFICGSYQLLGHYYKAADGKELEGLGIFDMYTQHFGHDKPRSVGNIIAELNTTIQEDRVFQNVNKLGSNIIGFENHGGHTFLNDGVRPLADVTYGVGNNSKDKTEGIHYKNAIGTYLHGPFLSKNAHLADYLIAKALNVDELHPLDDTIVSKAYSALLRRFK